MTWTKLIFDLSLGLPWSQKTSYVRSGRSKQVKHHKVKGQLSCASSKLLLSLYFTPTPAQILTWATPYLLTQHVWLVPSSSLSLSSDRRKTSDAFNRVSCFTYTLIHFSVTEEQPRNHKARVRTRKTLYWIRNRPQGVGDHVTLMIEVLSKLKSLNF